MSSRAFVSLTPQITERMSATRRGYNFDIIDSLATQKADSVVGTCLISIALIIAIIYSATTPSNVIFHSSRIFAILFSITSSAIVYLLLLFISSKVKSYHRIATARIITSKRLDRLFKNKTIPLYEIQSLRFLNEKFLNLIISTDSSNKDFLMLLANDVSLSLPEGIQIEEESSSKTKN
jgi:hypothetical protein